MKPGVGGRPERLQYEAEVMSRSAKLESRSKCRCSWRTRPTYVSPQCQSLPKPTIVGMTLGTIAMLADMPTSSEEVVWAGNQPCLHDLLELIRSP